MIRPSPELLAVADRLFKAVERRDYATLRNLFADSEHATHLGSDADELWIGKTVREGLAAHFGEMPELERAETTFSQAFECGDVGWSLHFRRLWFAGREQVDFRMSFVWVLVDGTWKIIQRHNSIARSNTHLHGREHQALKKLMEAAQKGRSLDQREGLASVMFTDIAGSSTLAENLGDVAWSRIVTEHFATIRGIVEGHGGQFVKSLGDGTMSSFVSARAALAAARDIEEAMDAQEREPRLGLRIGLHTGDVVQSENDFFGSVVNKSARLTALAGPGEIYLSDVTRAILGAAPEFTFSPPIPARLEGFEGEHMVHRLDWRAKT